RVEHEPGDGDRLGVEVVEPGPGEAGRDGAVGRGDGHARSLVAVCRFPKRDPRCGRGLPRLSLASAAAFGPQSDTAAFIWSESAGYLDLNTLLDEGQSGCGSFRSMTSRTAGLLSASPGALTTR